MFPEIALEGENSDPLWFTSHVRRGGAALRDQTR
jgi:hypothetical protein